MKSKQMNELRIELIEKIDYDDFERMWIRLTCGSEVGEVCFEPCTDGTWAYLDGDYEPLMPDHVKKAWDSIEGDNALTSIWNGNCTEYIIE